jgi:hypothetical protein
MPIVLHWLENGLEHLTIDKTCMAFIYVNWQLYNCDRFISQGSTMTLRPMQTAIKPWTITMLQSL